MAPVDGKPLPRFLGVWVTVAALSLATTASAQSVAGVSGFYTSRTFPQPDGASLLPGGVLHGGERRGYDFAIIRLGPDGNLDTAFGEGGLARLPVWGDYEFAGTVAVQTDGRIIVAGEAGDPARPPICAYLDCGTYGVVVRLFPDGRIDPEFNGGAPLVLGIGHLATDDPTQPDGQYIDSVEVGSDGSIALFDDLGHRMIARIDAQGALDNTFIGPLEVRLLEFVSVIEYYNPLLDHYFLTTDRAEIGMLERGAFMGWARTSNAFHAWPPGSQRGLAAARVCRLYGDPRYGLNTHFYSAVPGECDELLAQWPGAWTLESRDAFRIDVPDADGACPAGDAPVFRLWNGRWDTNSRYTTSRYVADQMMAKGWQWMSYGQDGAALCAAP